MNINFTGRNALVTGAGKGIGRCIALKLSKLGAKVYAISRTEADLDSLKEEIVAKGIISRKGSGAIVNISSITSTQAFPGVPIYCTTKAAMDMLTKSMALEFGPFKIRVNSCNPGVVLTPMTEKFLVVQEQKDALTGRIPMGRFIEQDEVANTVVFLLSDYATMINGALVPVDGGHSIHISPNPVLQLTLILFN